MAFRLLSCTCPRPFLKGGLYTLNNVKIDVRFGHINVLIVNHGMDINELRHDNILQTLFHLSYLNNCLYCPTEFATPCNC
jgi:hypothetical protein